MGDTQILFGKVTPRKRRGVKRRRSVDAAADAATGAAEAIFLGGVNMKAAQLEGESERTQLGENVDV